MNQVLAPLRGQTRRRQVRFGIACFPGEGMLFFRARTLSVWGAAGVFMPHRARGSSYLLPRRGLLLGWSTVGGTAQTLRFAIGRKNRQRASFRMVFRTPFFNAWFSESLPSSSMIFSNLALRSSNTAFMRSSSHVV